MSISKCPKCGTESAGKFCLECGTSISTPTCVSCGSSIKKGGHFCPECGTPVGAPAPTRGAAAAGSRLPWIIAGIAVVVLIVVAVARSNPGAQPAATPAVGGGEGSGSGIATTDLSSMTPREQANRLFDRVLTAAERGDSGEVAFFTPMAIQAYQNLGQLDPDSRYDVGMILSVAGDRAGALAQADSLEQSFPNHLLAKVIRATIAQTTGDNATLSTIYREYLDAFDGEIAQNRFEYNAHRRTVDSFRAEAVAGAQ